MPELPSSFRPRGQLTLSGTAKPVLAAEYSVAPSQPPSQFLEYWHVLRANILWISLLAAIGAGLGWLVGFLQPSMYQARTVLDIRSLNENFLNPREGTSIGATGSVLPESYIQTEIKILSSDSLRERAVKQMAGAPQVVPPPVADGGSFFHSLFERLSPAAASYKVLTEDAAHRVKVRAVGNTRIVEVLCDARDGQLAANMCNNLAKAYIEYNLESRYQSTKETGDWLQSQLDDVRKRLTKAENDLKDSSKETAFMFDSDSSDNPTQERLRQIQAELSQSQAERVSKESDYMIASSRSADALPLAMDAGPIREYRMRIEDLNRQLAEASATMTPEHYKVRELKMQIAEVQRALDKEHDGLIKRLKSDYDTAQRRESVFSGMYEKQASQVSEHADKEVRYNMLKREVDSERKLYETLLQKVDEVGLSAALRTSTISVVDPAVAPGNPYSPRFVADIGVGLFGGSILGLSLSLLRLRADRTLHGPGEASIHLQLRELGVIPSLRNRRVRLMLQRIRSRGKPEFTALKVRDQNSSEAEAMAMPRSLHSSTALATWLRIPEMTEAFFGTMSSLRFATERGQQANVIVLTSPDPGEGKTTVATNLSIALAQIGRRVLLVDGDLRKPSLNKIFDVATDGGLAALVESSDPIEEISLDRFIVTTPIGNLSLLPTRPDPEGISTKVHSTRMRALIQRLRREYDHVIIDSPPMLQISDARVLGWLADGVLLVLRSRKTTKESALAACDCLLQDGTHVLGTVLNDWSAAKNDKYNSYHSYFATM
jgi:succinoglycan biosynthesis transport protein ExoP